MPDGCVTHLEAQLLRQLVNREIHPIRCAESCRRKAQVALRLGRASKDYDDWLCVWFNPEWVRLSWVVSEDLCQLLGRRIDQTWRRMGHPGMAVYEQKATAEYDWLWLEKYDYSRQEIDDYWDEIQDDYESQLKTEAIFRDGLGL